ncbi:MRP family ATP-binding protein [Halobacteriales archaeon SW_12_71_31]|nr:MAG: MRP family ATP-binding protein [Halobacteriales archaeon SW_12_71_31]
MDERDVRDRLRAVEDPALGDDIVSLGLVNEVDAGDERVAVDLGLGAPYSPAETAVAEEVRTTLAEADAGVEVELSASVDRGADGDVMPGVKNVVAVASGKGGVGKSTVAVNVAAGLADRGARVGLFDADVYGPNVPRMLGAEEPPRATEEETLVPPERYGMKLMSMAFLVGEDDPVIWRGPMVHKVITQLWEDVEWGALDYMVIDLPPGTGDTQLTLLQSVPITGAAVVTTPQPVAVDDARKGLEMFGTHDTPVLGVAENMGTFRCPDCGGEHDVFGSGGGRELADEHQLPFLGSIPLDPSVRTGDESGRPVVLDEDSEVGERFREVTAEIADSVGIVARRAHAGRVEA